MAVPIDEIKIKATKDAHSLRQEEMYANPLAAGVINFEDLYHITLWDVAASYILEHKAYSNTLNEDLEKDQSIQVHAQNLVAIVQGTSAEDAYERFVQVNTKISNYHNQHLAR